MGVAETTRLRDYDELLHKGDNPDHIYFVFTEISAVGKNIWFV